jgi:DNA (cytosine-5)-methyltransferase 1
MDDPRASTISAYLKVVEKVRPEVLLFENVGAFTFSNRNEGLIALERGIEKINRKHRTNYVTQLLQLNAADYGVPQLRERVFVLAHRSGKCLTLPKPTHGPKSDSGEKYLSAWDAIGALNDLPVNDDLSLKGRWAELMPSIPEGQNYLWHTPRNSSNGAKPLFGWRTRFWSFLLKLSKDQPSWTISASPGPATGPFHWKNRLLSLEELCLVQTFPSDYEIKGSSRSARRQIGNAVPAALSELLGLEIRRQLLGHRVRTAPKLLPRRRADCPSKESIRPVPRKYLSLCASHRDHPGTGLGPSALRRKLKQVQISME